MLDTLRRSSGVSVVAYARPPSRNDAQAPLKSAWFQYLQQVDQRWMRMVRLVSN